MTVFGTSLSIEQLATLIYAGIVLIAFGYILWKAYKEMKAKDFAKYQQRQKWLLSQKEEKLIKRDEIGKKSVRIPEGMEKNIQADTREFSQNLSPLRDISLPNGTNPTHALQKRRNKIECSRSLFFPRLFLCMSISLLRPFSSPFPVISEAAQNKTGEESPHNKIYWTTRWPI